jgi:arabinose-5-phosphate isomerase
MIDEELPIVPATMHLGEAIIKVSAGKLGLGIALNDDKTVAGVITDGDIRRAMERWQAAFFDHTVNDIMTKTPKTVTTDTRIAEIQRIMNQNKIHNVLVVDEKKRLIGVVDRYACDI